MNVQGLTPPFLLSVTSNGQSLYGFASQGNSTANLNQLTTAVLQAYYQASGTGIAAVFGGTVSAANVPDQGQLATLDAAMVNAIQPYVASAGIGSPASFDPFTSPYKSGGTGFAQLLTNTSISSNLASLSLTSTSGATKGQTSTTTSAAKAPAGTTSSTALDLVTFTTSTTLPGTLATTTSSTTIDMCRTHGTPIPGSLLYDCVASMTLAPAGVINIAPGGSVSLNENAAGSSQIAPVVLAYDAAGYLTPIPSNGKYLTWAVGSPVVISVTPTTVMASTSLSLLNPITDIVGLPTITALNVGSSSMQLSDSVTKVSASMQVNVMLPPTLLPSPLVIPYGQIDAHIWMSDGTNPIAGPPLCDLVVADTTRATYASIGYYAPTGYHIIAGLPGVTQLTGTCQFGNYGNYTIPPANVCVASQNDPTCAFTLTSLSIFSASPQVAVGGTLTLLASGMSGSGVGMPVTSSNLIWTSSNTTVATVAGGAVTGIAAGSATIIAKDPATGVTSNALAVTVSAGGPSGAACPGAVTASWSPTTFTGTYTTTSPKPSVSAPADSGSFTGSLTPLCSGSTSYWIVSNATMSSTLYGGLYSVGSVSASDFGDIKATSVSSTGSGFTLLGTGVAPGAYSYTVDSAGCKGINWTTGPLAGLSGTSSTGTGTFDSVYGMDPGDQIPSSYYVVALGYYGTCTITVQ